MKAIVCLGKYAAHPYVFEKLDLSVFCMEELSYVLREKAYLLGPEIMNDRMLRFIGNECDVPELVGQLHPMVHQKGSLSEFVTTILRYVGLYGEDEIRGVEYTLKMGSGLSDFEKRKVRIDYLVEKKKYYPAIEEYDALLGALLENGQEDGEKLQAMAADLLHNKGVAYASLMCYEEAAGCFLEAYECGGAQESYRAYLAAKRMALPEDDYVALAAGLKDRYEDFIALEKRMEELQEGWQETEQCQWIRQLAQMRLEGDASEYRRQAGELVEGLKTDYRDSITLNLGA